MEIKIFTLRFEGEKGQFMTEEMEAFCANKRIVESKSAFFQTGNTPWWTVYKVWNR
ncbi:MAG: hypothetical protein SF052_13235 [Bacteroidia bacterium]|nr:hypothetical protein [Bacteroidia bacterium]